MDGFGGAPRFLAYPRAFTVQSGADAVLSCQITGDPRPSILWEKDKTPIEPSGRFHVEAKGDLYSLLVSHATPQDSGLYVCKAKNSVGETYAAATLKVEVGEPREEGCSDGEVLTFLVAPSSTRVCRGEDVMFACRVSGQPCLVLEWEKDGRKLSDLFESSHFAVGQEPEDWHFLKLFGARPPDAGVYVCRARSGSQEALAAAVLLVEPRAPPDGLTNGSPADGPEPLVERQQRRQRHVAGRHAGLEIGVPNGTVPARSPAAKAFAVSAGKHAKFRCYVTGKPKPEIIWQKDGEPLAPSRRHLIYEDREGYFILKVLYCKPQDQGLYVCTASNTAGQTLSAGYIKVKEHRLRFQVQLADVEVAEREDAVLECQVPLETIPTSWYLEDRELQPSHKYVMEERGVLRRLTIRDARTDDDGIYLCQMKDKGRSIAEVSVRGVITKRLPRKLDVMEGENAVFCVETQEALEGICWSRDGLQLRESPRTVLKSFGRTHLLVLVHVTRQDAGIISFAIGESQTSSQLRVKCVKRDPPSAPVAAEMSVAESNTALLMWCPAPDAHLRPPSRYLLERRGGGGGGAGGGWVQCLATDLPGHVRVLGDSVPCEADYCFRVCAANEHGQSSPVEFPGSVHLAPAARVERGLQDVWVRDGEDARFSLELSATVHGTWFLDGARLGEEEEEEAGGQCSVRRHGMEHLLLIEGVRLADSGAQVTFVSGSVRDSATLHVQAPQVRISPVPGAERLQEVPSGLPVLLECQVSPPGAPVRWLKDGEAVPLDDVIAVQAEGCVRRLLLRSAGPSDTGTYTCDAGEDAVSFVVTVTEAPVRIVSSNEEAPHAYVAGQRVELWCQLSRPAAPVRWYKDGEEVEAGESLVLEQEGPRHRLVLPCAQPQDTGEFVCDAGGDSVFYTVTVAEAPVRIVSSNEEAPHAYVAGQRVELWCQLSRPAAPVRWYKDGEEVEAGKSLVLEQEGLRCQLVLPCARPQDTGEFICNAGDASVSYHVLVAEPAVRILHPPQRSLELLVQAPERVELRCEISVPDAPVRWFKDGLEVDETDNLLLLAEGAWRCLLIPRSSAEDVGEYICESKDEAVSFDVKVSEPPVRILQPCRPLPVVTVSPGETVTLGCELSRADAPVRWAKEGVRLEAGGSLVLEEEGAHRRLLIPAARAEHSGKYVCDTADDTVTFTVQVLDPLVRILERDVLPTRRHCRAMEDLVLEVHLSHAHGEVKWYKDGEKLQDTGRVRLEEDGARRSLVVLGATGRDAGEYLCDTGDDSIVFFVTVEVPEPPVTIVGSTGAMEHHCLVAGEDLVLACELSRPDATVRWLRDGQEVQPGERVQVEARGVLQQLTICGAQPGDSGCYVCDAASDRMVISVEVSAQPVRVVNKEEAQSPLEVLEGDSVTLVARLSPETATVQWQKDGQTLRSGGRLLVCSEGAARSLTIKQVELDDSGIFLCDAGDDEVHFTLHVKEAPVLFVNKREQQEKLLVLEGGSAVLSAVASTERADVTWLGPRQAAVTGERCELRRDGRVHSLVLHNVAKEDAGVYTCLSPHDQMQFDVSVRELQVKFLRGLSDVRARQGERVVLWCELCKARGDVVWRKDGRALAPGPRRQMMAEGRERSLVLSRVEPKDAGEYCCESNDDRTLATLTVQVPRVVEIITELQSLTVLEGDDATFKCLVSPEDVAVTWQLNGQPVVPGERLLVTRSGLCHSLTLRQCQPGDAATVTANAEGLVSRARLSVQEAQVLFVRKLQDVVAEEQGDACLEVEVSHEAAEVQWLKQGVLLQPGSKYQMQESGCWRTLTIRCLDPADRGTYRCESLHDRTQARLCVEPQKVSIRTPLADVETFEKETATFHLELSHPGVPGVWTRDGIRVKPSGMCQISATGCRHSLTLEGLALEDSGTITFTADTLRCSARLLVREPPVTLVRVPRDLGVPETGVAIFECELSRPSAEVKWFKDGQELQPGPNCRIYSAGRRRVLQLSRCELADAGTYTCDAGDCRASATLHVQERQVCIVQDLQDAQVREGDNAVFTCEASHGDVKGEWFRDGEKIKVSSTVKIRQEGTRHFLLLCAVRPEDAGLIRFAAGMVVSEASLRVEALPIRIVKPLRDKTVLARHKATLECTVSHARGRVRWLRGDTEIFAGDKYEICNLDCYRTLIIHRVGPEDEDSYTCDAFDDRSTARLLVEGEEAPGGAPPGAVVPPCLTPEGHRGPRPHAPLLARV
ncbi:PREDICTED: LOW QUALITY PROTEIN: obscurin-like protein 1 [Nipponia nippon]|uniref:LOW QUALITY PROTEIN: obscurin-like protein 1 n=1 Tax=Nipponia nippon TaxID=128390 RepID=UPI0005112615|nr:PREDICTED: LOW QUALITY PROTEIN: obscurin-like protein 1 [Nipponia nippon]